MAPVKFDENIREKLDDRTLQPSAEAWNQLSKRLDGQEKKGSYKTIWLVGIAASVVGVLLFVSQFLNDKSAQEIIPQVVDTPEAETIMEQESKTVIANEDINKNIETIKTPEKPQLKNVESSVATIKDNIVSEDNVIIRENVAPELKGEANNKIAVVPEKLTFEEETIQHVVAKIKMLQDQDNHKEVTDEAIEALLLQAQNEITLQKLYKENSKVVDADLLLQDVEAELDQSFRTKVFETLKASYSTVKTAVAQRND